MITAGSRRGFRGLPHELRDHHGRGMTIVNAIRSGQSSSSIVLGARGFLGVQVTDRVLDTASQVGLQITLGALVVEVVPGTPAEQAGIPQYGAIVAIDGRRFLRPAPWGRRSSTRSRATSSASSGPTSPARTCRR